MDDEAETEASPMEVGLLSVRLLLTILVGGGEAGETGSDSHKRSLQELKSTYKQFKINTRMHLLNSVAHAKYIYNLHTKVYIFYVYRNNYYH